MLRRVKIQGYKSLRDLEVELKPLSVLFGPNAVGKSNFLDALQLLSKLVSSRTLKEAFDPPYRGKPLESFSFPENGIKGLMSREKLCFSMEVDFTLSDATVHAVNRQIRDMRRSGDDTSTTPDAEDTTGPVRERNLRYRIEVEMRPKSGFLQVSDEYLAALNSKGQPTGKREPFLSRRDSRLHLRLEGQAHPTYLDRYLDHSILSLPHYPPHYPHMVAARYELASLLFFYFEPRERMRAPNAVKEVRHIGLMGEELPAYLNTLKVLEPKQFYAVEKAVKMILPRVEGIVVEVSDLGEVELRLREEGVEVPARVLSEGTLRILGMLALTGAKDPPALVGFEEPENGIHPRRIELVAELLKTRAKQGQTQYIVTTHSPILPDLIPDDSLYVVSSSGRGTQVSPFSAWGPLARATSIADALADQSERLPISERILRGDFDA